jgi:hypothetical protein
LNAIQPCTGASRQRRHGLFAPTLPVKKHAVKLAVYDAGKLRRHKHPVDAHLIILRKLEVVGRVRAVLFLYDQNRGFERRVLVLLAHNAGCAVEYCPSVVS